MIHSAVRTKTSSTISALSTWISGSARDHGSIALKRAKAALLDTLGCICLGSDRPPPIVALRAVSDSSIGPSLIIGTRTRLAPDAASFVNATAAHALDFDDWDVPANSHPSAVLIPTLLALAEKSGASGREVLDAYIVGLEVIVRLGEAVNMNHFYRGWHTTATLCVFGSAAASARLLKLDQSATAAALGIAVSMAAGNHCQIGTMTKPLHAGFSAKNGILAAMLGGSGATSSGEAFELGFAVSHCGGIEHTRFPALASKLGNPVAIEEHGLVIKRYPSCGYTHRIVDGVIDLCRRHQIRPKDIATITATIPQHFLNALRYRVPKDEREALFSLPYCVSAAAHDRALSFDHFTPSAVSTRPVIDFIQQVHVETYIAKDPNANMDASTPDTIKIELKDGTVLEERIDYPVGMPPKEIKQTDLETKFRDCCKTLLSKTNLQKVIDLTGDFDRLDSVRPLMTALETASSR